MHRIARTALLLAGLSALGACSGRVHPRVWQNGEYMTSSSAYRQVMAGDRSVAAQRRLHDAASPLRMYARDVPYPYFGKW